jgi:alkylhydroperoxidase/carboxymuconolactone decarboxylase family protein YurZ
MTQDDKQQRKAALLEQMAKERGYMHPSFLYLAEKDLDFLAAYNALYRCALNEGKELPVKTREFIAMAILAYRGLADGVFEHAKRAMQHGATVQELMEAFETMVIPGGAPTFATGLAALMRIEASNATAAASTSTVGKA